MSTYNPWPEVERILRRQAEKHGEARAAFLNKFDGPGGAADAIRWEADSVLKAQARAEVAHSILKRVDREEEPMSFTAAVDSWCEYHERQMSCRMQFGSSSLGSNFAEHCAADAKDRMYAEFREMMRGKETA